MKCPYCGSQESKVVDKRPTENEEAVRRRRECLKCSKRFTTYERVEVVDLFVIKKDGEEEPFSRDKVKAGIMKAVEKREITEQQVDEIVDRIEGKLLGKQNKSITSKEIGDLVMKELKKLDKVAYVRFASVYREFEDIKEFEEELKELKK